LTATGPHSRLGSIDHTICSLPCKFWHRLSTVAVERFVPVKTVEQQAALMMVGLRDRLIRNRTQLSSR
jgi:hypothetical protein